jgi:hypothetical protein
MFVVIEGRHKNKKVVEKYVDNLFRALKINRLQRLVNIKFKGTLDGYAQGLCLGDRDYAEIEIGTKGQSFMRQMQALAHEMVHARQFLRGQLTSEGGFAWKGRKADGYEYMNQPWEKEAYRLERELFLDCFPFDEKVS